MPLLDRVLRRLADHSEGLRLAVEHGPLAGPVIEYVTDNQPRGRGWFGRRVDRWFLDLESNAGTRERTRTTKQLVAEILARRRSAGVASVVLDVASGTARYLRELGEAPDVTIVCHDRNPRQVMWGRELVDAEGLQRFTFAVGDATDEASYLTRHDPDIILAIQLFPYLRDDNDVKTVMRLAYHHLRREGCLICTTIVKPPSGAAFWSADAFGLRPACRSPDTIKTWLAEAGFQVIDQRYSEPNGFALIGWKMGEPKNA